MWWHNTWTLTPSISVNVFFKHLADELYAKKDLYGNKDPIPAESALAMLQTSLDELQKLPQEYRQFYLRKMRLILNQSIKED